MAEIDLKDRRILSELDMDARMPLTQLAKRTGLSRQVVEYRLRRMKAEQVIFGSRATFDSVAAGFKWYRVVLRLLNVKKEEKDGLLAYLASHKHVFWLGEVGGNWDLVVNFICRDNFAFNSIFERFVSEYGKYIRDYEILIYVTVSDMERSYLLAGKRERRAFHHRMELGTFIPDALDKEIIRELAKNADITNVELANRHGTAPNTIKNRIEEMKKRGLLLGFRLFINPSALGYQSRMLFLELMRLDLSREKELVSYLKTVPNVTFIVKHIGRWRIGTEIETRSDQEFQDIFVNIRGRFSDIVTDFESFPLFRDHVVDYYPEGILEEET